MRYKPRKIIDKKFRIGKTGVIECTSCKAGKLNIRFFKCAVDKTCKIKERHSDFCTDEFAVGKATF